MGAKQGLIRAVLDTNVIVSALILEGSVNQLVPLWQQRKFHLIISKAVLNEYLRVLAYPKFQLSSDSIKAILARELFPFVEPVEAVNIPPVIREDPSDDIFLAAAKAGKCHYLVSGDRHLLSLKRYANAAIVSVQSFLRQFRNS